MDELITVKEEKIMKLETYLDKQAKKLKSLEEEL